MAEIKDQAENNLQRKFRISPLNFATAFFFYCGRLYFHKRDKNHGHAQWQLEYYRCLDIYSVWFRCVIPGSYFP